MPGSSESSTQNLPGDRDYAGRRAGVSGSPEDRENTNVFHQRGRALRSLHKVRQGSPGTALDKPRPERNDTAILNKWPRQEGKSSEGQISLLPSFLMSRVNTIPSRSISSRRRIKLPRHSVRPR